MIGWLQVQLKRESLLVLITRSCRLSLFKLSVFNIVMDFGSRCELELFLLEILEACCTLGLLIFIEAEAKSPQAVHYELRTQTTHSD